MLNLIEQANVLKNLDDAMLQQEMQSPSGNAPPFLVLSEINRRKDMRQRYADQLETQKPATTVMQDLSSRIPVIPGVNVQPPPAGQVQGAGAQTLPMPGGLAAAAPQAEPRGFASGGLVDAAPTGDYSEYVAGYQKSLAELEEEKKRAVWRGLIAAGAGIMGSKHSNTLQNVGIGIGEGVKSYGQEMENLGTQETNLRRGLFDISRQQHSDELARLQAVNGSAASYSLAPVFFRSLSNPDAPLKAGQLSSDGGVLMDGVKYPGIPEGYEPVARPENLQLKDTGTGITAIDSGTGEARVVAPIDNAGKKFDENFGAGFGTQVVELRDAASTAQESLRANERARALLDSGTITGFGANFRLGLGRALQQVGYTANDDAIANTEAYIAGRVTETGRLISMFGAGTGLSDADRQYAAAAAAGNIDMSEEGIRRILRIADEVAREAIDKYNTVTTPLAGRSSVPEAMLTVQAPGTAPAVDDDIDNLAQKYLTP